MKVGKAIAYISPLWYTSVKIICRYVRRNAKIIVPSKSNYADYKVKVVGTEPLEIDPRRVTA